MDALLVVLSFLRLTYFLVVLSLLRECGVPEGQLVRLQKHHRFIRLSEEIRTLL